MKTQKILTGFLKCGDCSGLDREALIAGTKAVCSEQGKLDTSKACPKFKADTFSLREMAGSENFHDNFQFVKQLMNNFPADMFGLLASVFLQEEETRRHGFYFGQPIYVRYRGTVNSNYMSNFMSAYVLTATDKDVRLVSADPRQKQFILTYDNTGCEGPSLYSANAFKPLREDMIERGKNVDPKEDRKTSESLKPVEDVDLSKMPKVSLDGFTGNMFEVMRANGLRHTNKSSRKMDGMDLVAKLTDGVMANKPKKRKKRKSGSIELAEL